MKHTPAPWHRCGGPIAGYKIINRNTKEVVLDETLKHCGLDHDANVRLITLAPDLLTALKELLASPDLCLDVLEDDTVQRMQKAQRLIKRMEEFES